MRYYITEKEYLTFSDLVKALGILRQEVLDSNSVQVNVNLRMVAATILDTKDRIVCADCGLDLDILERQSSCPRCNGQCTVVLLNNIDDDNGELIDG